MAVLRGPGSLERRLAAAEAVLPAPPAGRPGAAIEELLRRLAVLAARLREEPGWREPTSEENAAAMAVIRAHLAERFGEETAARFVAALEGRGG